MKAPWPGLLLALVLVGAGPLAGCTRAENVNPNLLAPKLVLDVTLHGDPLVYVHSAFTERAYDRIELSLDNASRRTAQYAYSLEERLNVTGAFLEVNVRSGESRFKFRGTFDIGPDSERVRVTVLDEKGEWADPRTFHLPFERILERVGDEPS